ncbi:MAG: methylated-DNA--[protein]-cysteine S-methyltransferase [Sphingobacteriales bacterium]|nr:methylated-DNA--[protein]-cysteine S-methyltransferase [Sphingobacteriales bacterium]
MKSYTSSLETPLGLIEINANGTGILSVLFLDDTARIESEENDFSASAKAELTEYFSGIRKTFDLPLNFMGTGFQQRVWSQLLAIPYGVTVSYLDLAKQLGDPKCIRAAASANGKNPFSIIVPCHRVVGSNDTLVGYAGGLWRKRWLLEHENKIANGLQLLF